MLIMVLFYCQNITQGWYTAMLTNTKILIADEDLRSRRSIKDALVKTDTVLWRKPKTVKKQYCL